MNQPIENTQVPNVAQFKGAYKTIVTELIQCRESAEVTQEFMAEWLNISRKRIIAFEKLKKIDLETLLKYTDKMSIDLKLSYGES